MSPSPIPYEARRFSRPTRLVFRQASSEPPPAETTPAGGLPSPEIPADSPTDTTSAASSTVISTGTTSSSTLQTGTSGPSQTTPTTTPTTTSAPLTSSTPSSSSSLSSTSSSTSRTTPPTSLPSSTLPTSISSSSSSTSSHSDSPSLTAPETPETNAEGPTALAVSQIASSRNRTAIIAASTASAAAVLILILIAIFCIRRRKTHRERSLGSHRDKREGDGLLVGDGSEDSDALQSHSTRYHDHATTEIPVVATSTLGLPLPNAPTLFRPRGPESGSIFREEVWPPPNESNKFIDSFEHSMLQSQKTDLASIVDEVMGPKEGVRGLNAEYYEQGSQDMSMATASSGDLALQNSFEAYAFYTGSSGYSSTTLSSSPQMNFTNSTAASKGLFNPYESLPTVGNDSSHASTPNQSRTPPSILKSLQEIPQDERPRSPSSLYYRGPASPKSASMAELPPGASPACVPTLSSPVSMVLTNSPPSPDSYTPLPPQHQSSILRGPPITISPPISPILPPSSGRFNAPPSSFSFVVPPIPPNTNSKHQDKHGLGLPIGAATPKTSSPLARAVSSASSSGENVVAIVEDEVEGQTPVRERMRASTDTVSSDGEGGKKERPKLWLERKIATPGSPSK